MNDLRAITEDIEMAARSSEMSRHVALDHGPELIAEIQSLRGDIYDMQEWETVERWLADPGSFNIFGEPFKGAM